VGYVEVDSLQNYFEMIKVNIVHRVSRANFFALVDKFVEKKKIGSRERGIRTRACIF
jgi:hypothetical protein